MKMSSLDIDDVHLKYDDNAKYESDDISGYASVKSERADSPMTPVLSKRGSNHPTAIRLDEKRMRREIANSNERRRMQSINAGFSSLRNLLPHRDGEKLSKATVLQQTADYIVALQHDKTRLLTQNSKLKHLLGQRQEDDEIALGPADLVSSLSSKKRKVLSEATRATIMDLEMQLDRERALRMHLEQKLQRLEELYPEKMATDITTEQVTLHYHDEDELDEMDDDCSPSVMMEPILIRRDSMCSLSGDERNNPAGPTDAATTTTTTILVQPVAHTESLLTVPASSRHIDTSSCAGLQRRQSTDIATKIVMKSPKIVDNCNSSGSIINNCSSNNNSNIILPSSLSIPPSAVDSNAAVVTSSAPGSGNAAASMVPKHLECDQQPPTARVYISSTSRQNLETIVEAIRHLEGDSMFDEGVAVTVNNNSNNNGNNTTQEVPLALTTKHHHNQRLIEVEDVNPFFQFTSTTSSSNHHHHHQQQRPGVIVLPQQT